MGICGPFFCSCTATPIGATGAEYYFFVFCFQTIILLMTAILFLNQCLLNITQYLTPFELSPLGLRVCVVFFFMYNFSNFKRPARRIYVYIHKKNIFLFLHHIAIILSKIDFYFMALSVAVLSLSLLTASLRIPLI